MMTTQQFKAFHRPANFAPYTIFLKDGRRFEIHDPFEVACSPDCNTIAAARLGAFDFFKLADVSNIIPSNGHQSADI